MHLGLPGEVLARLALLGHAQISRGMEVRISSRTILEGKLAIEQSADYRGIILLSESAASCKSCVAPTGQYQHFDEQEYRSHEYRTDATRKTVGLG